MRRLFLRIASVLVVVAALAGRSWPAQADSTGARSAGGSLPTPSQIVSTAEQYLGFPYASIGDDPSTGFSCIGLVHYVYARNGLYVPEELSRAYASAPRVQQKDLQPGDLVFFKDTLWRGISHVDIYVGNGIMIGADSFQTGVQIDALGDAYWQAHYLGATRPLADPTGTPVDTTGFQSPDSAPPSATTAPNLDIRPGTALMARGETTVYSGPGFSYSSIATLGSGVALTAVQTQGDWVDVSYAAGSQYGWLQGATVVTASLPGTTGSPDTTPTPAAASSSTGAPASSGHGPSAPHASVPARHDAGQAVVVAVSDSPLYSGPGSAYIKLNQLARGTTVTVQHTQGGWDQVALPDGTVGWVDDRDLASGTRNVGGHVSPRSTSGARSVVVTADALMVRAAPGRAASALGRVYAGDRLHVWNTRSGWDHVSFGGLSGWVSAAFVR